jgi:hypothetical protein
MVEPLDMGQLRTSKYSGAVPWMLVDQLLVSLTIDALERSTAAAARTDGTSR